MTDRTCTADRPPPTISDNIRVEMTRRRLTAVQVRAAMPEDVRIADRAWENRMTDPGLWRMRELEAIADILGVPLRALVPEDRRY